MFAKISTALVALTLTGSLGLLGIISATQETGDAPTVSGGDVCVTAVHKDNPEIRAQRGNCPAEVPAPVEDLPEGEPATWYSMNGGLQIEDRALARVPYRFTITNTTTGKVIEDVSREVDESGSSHNNWAENYEGAPVGSGGAGWYASPPAQRDSMDSYEVELFINGKTYTYAVPSSAGVRDEWDYYPDKPYGMRVSWFVGTVRLVDDALVKVD